MKLAILSVACLLAFAVPALAQDEPQVYKPGNGVTSPKLLRDVKPFYPPEVMKTGINGVVRLECVVRPDGTVADIRVIEPLEPGLDAEAIRTLRQWRFTPGEKNGRAVPVQISVELSFLLR